MAWVSRKTLYAIHRWTGLHCGVVLFVICLSGTIATLGPELDALIDPRLRIGSEEPRLSLAEIQAKVESDHPGWSIASITAADPGFAASVEIEREDGVRLAYLVHPGTGQVLGPTSPHRARILFRVFHKQFYIFGLGGIHGTYLVGLYGPILMLSGITGLCCYARFWTKLFVLRRRAGWSVFWRDLHRLLGVWGAVLLLLWGATGTWYLVMRLRPLWTAPVAAPAKRIVPRTAEDGVDGPFLPRPSLADLVATATREFPGFDPRYVTFAADPKGAVTLYPSRRTLFPGRTPDLVKFDGVTGAILSAAPPTDLSGTLDQIVDPLHFGTFGGLPTRLLWFAGGLVVSALVPIGATIWLQRSSRSRAVPSDSSSPAIPARAGVAARSRVEWWCSTVITTAILLTAGGYTWRNVPPRIQSVSGLAPHVSLGEKPLGPYQLELQQFHRPGRQPVSFRAVFPDGQFPNLRRLEGRLLTGSDGQNVGAAFQGTRHAFHAKFPDAPDLAGPRITVTLEDRDGQQHSAEFDIAPLERFVASPPTESRAPLAVSLAFGGFLAVCVVFTALWFRLIR